MESMEMFTHRPKSLFSVINIIIVLNYFLCVYHKIAKP